MNPALIAAIYTAGGVVIGFLISFLLRGRKVRADCAKAVLLKELVDDANWGSVTMIGSRQAEVTHSTWVGTEARLESIKRQLK